TQGRGADTDELGNPLKLEAAIAYARQHNPEIRAAAAGWRAAQARPQQAGALPDPMVDVGYHNEGFERLRLGDTDFAFLRIRSCAAVTPCGRSNARAKRRRSTRC